MSEIQQARINVLLDRMRFGVATSEDAEELRALLDGQIEEIKLAAAPEEEEEE